MSAQEKAAEGLMAKGLMSEEDMTRAVSEAFSDLSFELPTKPHEWAPTFDQVRNYRQRDNVDRPSRIERQAHGMVVHHLTTGWAIERARANLAEAREAKLVEALQKVAQFAEAMRASSELIQNRENHIGSLMKQTLHTASKDLLEICAEAGIRPQQQAQDEEEP